MCALMVPSFSKKEITNSVLQFVRCEVLTISVWLDQNILLAVQVVTAIFISLVSSGIVMAERGKQVVIPFLYTVC